jgi:hypothetical protein
MISPRDSSRLAFSHIYPPNNPPTLHRNALTTRFPLPQCHQQVVVTAERAPIPIRIPALFPLPFRLRSQIGFRVARRAGGNDTSRRNCNIKEGQGQEAKEKEKEKGCRRNGADAW